MKAVVFPKKSITHILRSYERRMCDTVQVSIHSVNLVIPWNRGKKRRNRGRKEEEKTDGFPRACTGDSKRFLLKHLFSL